MAASQFSLRTRLLVVTAACCLALAVRWVGVWPLVKTVGLIWCGCLATSACCVLLSPIAAWSYVHHFAPTLARNGTALAMMVLFVGTLVVCGINQSREESRRNQCLYHLTKLGQDGADLRERFPPENRPDAGESRWSQLEKYARAVEY